MTIPSPSRDPVVEDLNHPEFHANAINFGVVAAQRFHGRKVVAVVLVSMMRSGLIERR